MFALVVTNGDLPAAKKLYNAVLEAELAGQEGRSGELIELELRRAWTGPRTPPPRGEREEAPAHPANRWGGYTWQPGDPVQTVTVQDGEPPETDT